MAKILCLLGVLSPLVLTILALVAAAIIAFPGKLSGGIDSRNLALIDTSKVVTKTDSITYHGLPDSHHYSKHKDFFVIYLHRYCSGKKEGNVYKPDFCSRVGRELFDQYRLWRVWGVNLAEPRNSNENSIGVTAIKTVPKTIFIFFTTAVVSLAFTTVFGFASLCSYWMKVLSAGFSSISSISALGAASLCQSLFPTLVNRTNSYYPPGKDAGATLTSQLGKTALAGLWLVAALSTSASILWVVALCNNKNGHGLVKRSPTIEIIPGIVRRATGTFLGGVRTFEDTSYEKVRVSRAPSPDPSKEHLVSSVRVSRAPSRNASQEDLASSARDGSKESYDEDRGGRPRYEPMRYRELPE